MCNACSEAPQVESAATAQLLVTVVCCQPLQHSVVEAAMNASGRAGREPRECVCHGQVVCVASEAL